MTMPEDGLDAFLNKSEEILLDHRAPVPGKSLSASIVECNQQFLRCQSLSSSSFHAATTADNPTEHLGSASLFIANDPTYRNLTFDSFE